METFDSISDQYDGFGSDFSSNARAGDFLIPGLNNTSYGVPVGRALPYEIRPYPEDTFIDAPNISSGNFIPLSSHLNVDGVILGKDSIILDVPREVTVACITTFSAIISYIDRYGNKGICFQESTMGTTNFEASFAFGIKQIVSIQIINGTANSNYFVSMRNNFELPFNDFQIPATLNHVSYENLPLYYTLPASAAPYNLALSYKSYVSALNTPPDILNGNVRPMFNPDSNVSNLINSISERGNLLFIQDLQNFGFTFKGNANQQNNSQTYNGFRNPNVDYSYISRNGSLIQGILGFKPYYEENLWRGWQG